MNIDWITDFEIAKQVSIKERKPILLQFEREKCSGCRKLDALTYTDENVIKELSEWFVPLKLQILEDHKIRSHFSAVWTPSFYVTDRNQKIYYKTEGYYNSEDFRMILRLALAGYLLPRGKYKETIELMKKGLELFPENLLAPKLMLTKGEAGYLMTWDNKTFRASLKELTDKYPDSLEARMWPWMD